MNKIHIPIRCVHLETVFEGSTRTNYALLEPTGDYIRGRDSTLAVAREKIALPVMVLPATE